MARRSLYIASFALVLLALPSVVVQTRAASTIHVPADQPSIQAAINAAASGDAVLVSPGVYTENINFNGKAVTVKSVNGPKNTIIDGGQAGTVVTFTSGETRDAVLQGFTIRNGNSEFLGGGIEIANSSPTLLNNFVVSNTGCSGTAGIQITGGAALLQGNVVSDNLIIGCSGFVNGGITVQSTEGVELIGNVVSRNTGGIQLLGAANVSLQQNAVVNNLGTGINVFGSLGGNINLIQNVIMANQGPGIVWDNLPPSRVLNNTVVNNALSFGPNGASELSAGLLNNSVDIENNLFIATGLYSAVFCTLDPANPPIFNNNDAFASNASNYAPGCPDKTGKAGNLATDPLFVGELSDDYLLQAGSPVIGKGKASATGLPAVDMVGNPRLTSGKLDIGAYEYNVKNKLALSAYNVQFGSQPEGLKSAVKTLTLTNQGSGPVAINSIDSGPSFPQTNDCGQSVAASASCHIKIAFSPSIAGFQSDVLSILTDATRNPQVVTVTGTGLPPGASLDLYGFSFPLQIIGTSSAPQTFTLTNDGQAPLRISSIVGAGIGFSETNNCPIAPATLNIGSSCTITVVCTPSQTGFFTGNISIYDNAPSSPQQISLQGTGISAGVATVSTTNLTFPTTDIGKSSAPQTVTLTNTGTGPLGILSISEDGDFPSTNNCPASLLAGGSCVISVIFTPSNNSSEFGSIFIQDDGQPGFINISSTGNGQSVTPILTSLSQGSAPVGIQNLNFIINGTGFFFGSQVFWNQTLVSSGVQGPTQLFVSVPDNLAATVGNAQITVVNPAPGGGTSNTLTFTVYKPLNYDFKTTSYNYISITGTNLNMGPFSGAAVISPFPLQVGGGSYTTLLISSMGNITFLGGVGFPGPIPTQFSSPLVAPFWDSLGPFGTNSDNNVFWQVVGTAPNRKMVVEWRNVPYCCTQDPTSTVRFEVVFSEGSSNLNFNYADTVFGGTNTADDNGATASVGVQVATGLGTQFSFDSAVLKSKTSLLWFPSDPTVQLSSSVLDFGYHQIGNASLRQTVTLKNNSIAPLTIDSIAINSSDFSQTNTCGTQLLSGKTCTISAAFRPSQLGAESAQLTINGNEKDAPLSITLNGIGTVDPTEVFPSRIDFGLQAVGSKSTSPVTLANASNQVLSVQKIVASPAAFSQTNNCGSSLAPGASCTVNLTFAPSHKGSVSGTLSMGLSSKPLVTVVQLTGAGK